MASSHTVELEAAKFLHKLIQESKDEPVKLATKLYVILQHMKSSGKEQSIPYQVISRAMETVISQNGLDIEALNLSRLPLNPSSQPSSQTRDSTMQNPGSSQTTAAGITKDTKTESGGNEVSRQFPSRLPLGPSSSGPDIYQGSIPHRSCKPFDHESPSSLDSRSANSQRETTSQDKQASLNNERKSSGKRKRVESSLSVESHVEKPPTQAYDAGIGAINPRKGKATNKVEPPGSFLVKGGLPSNFHGGMLGDSSSYPLIESGFSNATPCSNSSYNTQDRSIPNLQLNANSMVQGAGPNMAEMNMLRSVAPRESGKSTISQTSTLPVMPFKEHHLKQLRAQCLVFLAFRNGLMPKKLHLEIALENLNSKEGSSGDSDQKELSHHKAKEKTLNDPINPELTLPHGRKFNARENEGNPPGSSSTGNFPEANLKMEDKKLETEMQVHESLESQAFLSSTLQPNYSNLRGLPMSNHKSDMESDTSSIGRFNHSSSKMGMNNQMKSEITNWTGIGSSSNAMNQSDRGGCNVLGYQHGNSHLSTFPLSNPILGVDTVRQSLEPVKDTNLLLKHTSQDDPKVSQIRNRFILDGREGSREQEEEEEEKSFFADLRPIPKYTTSEKWIMDQQKRTLIAQQNWKLKEKKTNERIATCFNTLKESVSSSEDISAKTKSVIELKKLQLLELQRRLRSGFLNDFFRPIAADIDHLKSMKKHKHVRRIKQLEKVEQKMKEERQKRIRERQKDFFGEIEVHKERLDDIFKIRRERWKNWNKHVKEFHKRKERIHREKIDKIQREKINLLKINDVEGYLRMVQDAKSDRVRQLLKETEKYLQKLGSKLQEAKAISMDGNQSVSVAAISEAAAENDDESDQAKHYLESNEKYYLMAHSIKESIAEQPTSLEGGKLREYQLNGLRWLVSLYNNHLNGILADEMGLGKTVQVISLICYLMETKNDRGPFLVVVPSSVLPGWESEINFWAPSIKKIVYAGPPEDRRRLFKEIIVQQKFNVLLTTYEYLMNKHDRPKLSKLHWHYIIIDEGHRIKNASCKLNAELKHYQSSHRLLLTGTPLQNNLEELWALLNFLLPNIFNSSEDFSQWFNKPFEGNGDSSTDQALLSEEENLLIINRLHQVLRPFVLRRLKHKVENELPQKIERLVRCEASAYQKLLMKRVEDNLGALGNTKGRSVHNSVMELRNICNHPYLSQLHTDEVDNMMPTHYLPSIVRHCGKLEMLDRLLPKLRATDHRVLFFSTMTRLLDVMEDYLHWKQYPYLRLDGHTHGGDRGALIDKFNQSKSPYFIFLLSIRAGGVGVNLQAADTVIIFDTDWNPQVDLQAQARAHRIGQKKDVLVLRLETVHSVEEQVRASAEHKLGVANQSITAGFFDNNTSAEDRKEYLETLLRECKKEESAPVLNDDGLNDLLARSESEIDVFESIDKRRREGEMEMWKKLVSETKTDRFEPTHPLPSRLVTDDDLKPFCEAMKKYEVPRSMGESNSVGGKRKSEYLGGLDTKHYGRGKRAREVRSYEEQWTEDEFEKICQSDTPESPKPKESTKLSPHTSSSTYASSNIEPYVSLPPSPLPSVEPSPLQTAVTPASSLEPPSVQSAAVPPPPYLEPLPPLQGGVTPPSKRGRGRPKRVISDISPSRLFLPSPPGTSKSDTPGSQQGAIIPTVPLSAGPSILPSLTMQNTVTVPIPVVEITPISHLTPPTSSVPVSIQDQRQATHGRGQAPRGRGGRGRGRGRGRTQAPVTSALTVSGSLEGQDLKLNEQQLQNEKSKDSLNIPTGSSNATSVLTPSTTSTRAEQRQYTQGGVATPTPRRRGKKQAQVSVLKSVGIVIQDSSLNENTQETSGDKDIPKKGNTENDNQEVVNVVHGTANAPRPGVEAGKKLIEQNDTFSVNKQPIRSSGATQDYPGKNSELVKDNNAAAPLKLKEDVFLVALPAIQTCTNPSVGTIQAADAPGAKYVTSGDGSLKGSNKTKAVQKMALQIKDSVLAEDISHLAIPVIESAPPGFELPFHRIQKQSGEVSDMKMQKIGDHVLDKASSATNTGTICDVSTLEKAPPGFDLQLRENDDQSNKNDAKVESIQDFDVIERTPQAKIEGSDAPSVSASNLSLVEMTNSATSSLILESGKQESSHVCEESPKDIEAVQDDNQNEAIGVCEMEVNPLEKQESSLPLEEILKDTEDVPNESLLSLPTGDEIKNKTVGADEMDVNTSEKQESSLPNEEISNKTVQDEAICPSEMEVDLSEKHNSSLTSYEESLKDVKAAEPSNGSEEGELQVDPSEKQDYSLPREEIPKDMEDAQDESQVSLPIGDESINKTAGVDEMVVGPSENQESSHNEEMSKKAVQDENDEQSLKDTMAAEPLNESEGGGMKVDPSEKRESSLPREEIPKDRGCVQDESQVSLSTEDESKNKTAGVDAMEFNPSENQESSLPREKMSEKDVHDGNNEELSNDIKAAAPLNESEGMTIDPTEKQESSLPQEKIPKDMEVVQDEFQVLHPTADVSKNKTAGVDDMEVNPSENQESSLPNEKMSEKVVQVGNGEDFPNDVTVVEPLNVSEESGMIVDPSEKQESSLLQEEILKDTENVQDESQVLFSTGDESGVGEMELDPSQNQESSRPNEKMSEKAVQDENDEDEVIHACEMEVVDSSEKHNSSLTSPDESAKHIKAVEPSNQNEEGAMQVDPSEKDIKAVEPSKGSEEGTIEVYPPENQESSLKVDSKHNYTLSSDEELPKDIKVVEPSNGCEEGAIEVYPPENQESSLKVDSNLKQPNDSTEVEVVDPIQETSQITKDSSEKESNMEHLPHRELNTVESPPEKESNMEHSPHRELNMEETPPEKESNIEEDPSEKESNMEESPPEKESNTKGLLQKDVVESSSQQEE